MFASSLMGHRQYGKNFTECENKREIKDQMSVMLRTGFIGLIRWAEEVVERREENRSETVQSMMQRRAAP